MLRRARLCAALLSCAATQVAAQPCLPEAITHVVTPTQAAAVPGFSAEGGTYGAELPAEPLSAGRWRLCRPNGFAVVTGTEARPLAAAGPLVLPADLYDAARPMLRFWLSGDALQTYLTTPSAPEAQPDLAELDGPRTSRAHGFPVLGYRDLTVAGRTVTAAQLLLPLDRSAATIWQNLLAQRETHQRALVLLDQSGSAEPHVRRLARQLLPLLTQDRVIESEADAVILGPGGQARIAPATSLGTLLAAPATTEGTAPLRAVLTELDRHSGGPVLALLGGDVPLPNLKVLSAAQPLIVAQVTPELDPELAESLADVAGDATLIGYSKDMATTLAARLLTSGAFRNFADIEASLTADMFAAQAAQGYLPTIPLSTAAEQAFQPQRNAPSWWGIPAWTVLDRSIWVAP